MLDMIVTLVPLVLGLAAWILAAASIRKKMLSFCSWCACACALWFPIYTIHHWVQLGDTSAILDCAQAYMLCATVLLLGTAALNLLAWHIRRKA